MEDRMTLTLLRNQAFIAGSWRDATGGAHSVVTDPATNEVLGYVPDLGSLEIQEAIDSSALAFELWRKTAPAERSRLLRQMAALIEKHSAELAMLLTREQGKPLREAEAEIRYGRSYFEWFAEEALRIYGDTIPSSHPERRLLVLKEPVGVVAAITPWNFPHAMIVRKIAAALAAGCTLIAKPAPETPLSCLALGALAEAAGIPAGVLNIVTGDAQKIGAAFMASNLIRKVTFTGSTEVGQYLLRESAATVKRMTLELGGNAPLVVFEDADIDAAVAGAMQAKYRNAGQTCVCVNRFLVHRSVAKDFISRFAAASEALRVGPGIDPSSDIGPLIAPKAVEKVRRLALDAVAKGATLVSGNIPVGDSLFIAPCILSGVTQQMSLWSEEIFGPLSAIALFDTEEEALALANDSAHGLAAYFYTRTISRVFRFAESLQYGMIGINDTLLSHPQAPFGGVKHSGFGREGSRYGLDDYIQTKLLSLGV